MPKNKDDMPVTNRFSRSGMAGTSVRTPEGRFSHGRTTLPVWPLSLDETDNWFTEGGFGGDLDKSLKKTGYVVPIRKTRLGSNL